MIQMNCNLSGAQPWAFWACLFTCGYFCAVGLCSVQLAYAFCRWEHVCVLQQKRIVAKRPRSILCAAGARRFFLLINKDYRAAFFLCNAKAHMQKWCSMLPCTRATLGAMGIQKDMRCRRGSSSGWL